MTEVQTFFKPEPVACPCGCERVGQLRKKPWRDGSQCVKNCKGCKHCRGLRSKRKGQRGQANAATLLGMPTSTIKPGHEEFSRGATLWEHKSGAQAGPVITRFRLSRDQAEASRAIGDLRPFVATFSHENTVVAVFDLKDGPQVVAGLAEAWGMVP